MYWLLPCNCVDETARKPTYLFSTLVHTVVIGHNMDFEQVAKKFLKTPFELLQLGLLPVLTQLLVRTASRIM